MYIANTPQILMLLESNKSLTSDQKSSVLSKMDAMKSEGKRAFAGEIAVEMGFVSQETLNTTLDQKSVNKAKAAVQDIQTIMSSQTTQDAPVWLKANWGNNGVNPAPKKPSVSDGISAAANIGQNIVMLANESPTLGSKNANIGGKIVRAVESSAELAQGLFSKSPTLRADFVKCMINMKTGLEASYAFSGDGITDRSGAPIKLSSFISERFKEINAAVMQQTDQNEDDFIGVEDVTLPNGRVFTITPENSACA